MSLDDTLIARCPVCGDGLEGKLTSCPRCETPHHDECYKYNDGCGIYACNLKGMVVKYVRSEPSAVDATKSLVRYAGRLGRVALELPFLGGRLAAAAENQVKDKGYQESLEDRVNVQMAIPLMSAFPFFLAANLVFNTTLTIAYTLATYAAGMIYEELNPKVLDEIETAWNKVQSGEYLRERYEKPYKHKLLIENKRPKDE